LFAAELHGGQLITTIAELHRHQEWQSSSRKNHRESPRLTIHLIADNYATHKHPEVKVWLAKHPRFHMHFTPTSSSWLNLVERFFRDLTDRIACGSFTSVKDLADTIITYLAARNQQPRRYLWKAKGEDILRKIQKARQAMLQQAA
jgi:transposase